MTKLKNRAGLPPTLGPKDESEERRTSRGCEKKEGWRSPGEKRTAARQATPRLFPHPRRSPTETCTWTRERGSQFHWVTHCGEEFVFVDGNPRECRLRFCPYCGGAIVIVDIKEKKWTPTQPTSQ